jgi:hypothetical protein
MDTKERIGRDELRKRLYLYTAYSGRLKGKQPTIDKLWSDVVEACKKVQ